MRVSNTAQTWKQTQLFKLIMFKIINMFLTIAILPALSAAYAAPGTNSKVDYILQSILQNNDKANIFISFFGGTKAALGSIQQQRFASREEQLNTVHDVLVANADRSQRGVLNILSSRGNVQFKCFWISNQVFVSDADEVLVHAIAEDPEVEKIEEEVIAHIFEPVEMANATLADEYQWGIEKIQAPEAWKELGAENGNGVVIATIDTGVRWTHETLRDNFLGDYGWLDPTSREPHPTDTNGHGTHTTGTIAGSNGIGVAPGAKWAACRGCTSRSCSQSDLIACGQFFACPTLADGSRPDCSKAPHLVSNSWGGGRGNTWYNTVIEAWHAAGIIPVFSIGNSGHSNCNTAESPGDQNVIGVGATTIDDAIALLSSVGPTTDGRMKPDIAAPGADVTSAYHTSDNAYVSLTGTSQACPHVAGTVALLVTRNKGLTYDEAKRFLNENTDKDLQFSGLVCDGVGDSQFPNHVFGSGRVNALKSVRAQTLLMKR